MDFFFLSKLQISMRKKFCLLLVTFTRIKEGKLFLFYFIVTFTSRKLFFSEHFSLLAAFKKRIFLKKNFYINIHEIIDINISAA